MKLTKEQKKNHNRIMTVIVLGLLVTAWVPINAGIWVIPATIYIGMGVFSIFLYWAWNKF